MSRRSIFVLLLAPCALLGALLLARHLLRPPLSAWRPIFRGIDYSCEQLESGRVAAVRVHLDAPGLDLMPRPLDAEAVAAGGHYSLSWPDLDLARHQGDILINTAIYYPGRAWESFPGRSVKAVDMIVVNGRATHFWQHSYLLWLDRNRTPRLNTYKPPKPEDIVAAALGLGIQGVQVHDGKPNLGAIGAHDVSEARAFIGIDPDKRQLFLLAFESATPPEMVAAAIRLGVKSGGMMDSGNATWMVFSPRAKGLPPYAGIRGGRPLGPWLMLRGAPLP